MKVSLLVFLFKDRSRYCFYKIDRTIGGWFHLFYLDVSIEVSLRSIEYI